MAASTALLLLLAMAALLIGRATFPRPAGPPQVGGGAEDTIEATVPAQPDTRTSVRRLYPDPGRGGASARPAPSTATTTPASVLAPAVSPSVLAAEGPLTATFTTENISVSGYGASVTIRNDGTNGATNWTVVITLPLLGLTVPTVTGAVMTQNGRQFTFTPVDNTRTVGPGQAVHFSFEVTGLGLPDGCTINTQPCAGIPG